MTLVDDDLVDLLVVGFGPVGATMAGLAARHGLSVLVLDREVDMFPLPRAAHCDHEILRILQQLGCADEVVGTMRINAVMDFLSASREPLLRFSSPGLAPSGWPASVLFHQPGFEAALRRSVHHSSAEVRLGVGVAAIDERDGMVVARTDDGSFVTARYAVGCDGARSLVRERIGATMHDLEFEEPWLVVDLVLEAADPALPDRALQVCDPARPHTLVPMPWPRFRFEFMLLPGEDPDAIREPSRVLELLSTWIDPAGVEVERAAVYTFHGLVAREWRRGPIFLAGDAAHQMPPFLGQGMCSGRGRPSGRAVAPSARSRCSTVCGSTTWSDRASRSSRQTRCRTAIPTPRGGPSVLRCSTPHGTPSCGHCSATHRPSSSDPTATCSPPAPSPT